MLGYSSLPSSVKEAKQLGLKRYFTNKPCIRGHICPRYTSTRKCAECSVIHCKKYNSENREKEAKRRAEYRNSHKEKERIYAEKYRSSNKEKISISQKLYREKNKIKLSKKQAEYYKLYSQSEEFRKRKASNSSIWAKNNKEKTRNRSRARRANLRASGKISRQDILNVLTLQKFRCANPMCLEKLYPKERNAFHVDHIYPVSKGGKNIVTNIQILCPACNMSKSNKLPHEWAKDEGFLI